MCFTSKGRLAHWIQASIKAPNSSRNNDLLNSAISDQQKCSHFSRFPFYLTYLKIATVSEVQNWSSLDESFSKHSVTLLEDMQEISIHV